MALNHSPKIVTDGLVFAYDMGNSKKSWKGKPTVNILSASGLAADTEQSGTSYPFVSTNITTYVLANWSASNNKFSMSFEGKRDYVSGGTGGGGDGYPVMYIYFSDWSWASSFGISTYTWSYSKSENITMPDPTGKTIYFSVYHMNAGNPGKSYSRNHQIEFNTFATPFVNGTRSNTQALIDLTGTNTITASSLTYASDGTFSFNGTSDYISTSNSYGFSKTDAFSAEVWIKVNNHSDRPTAAAGIFGKGHWYANNWDIWLYNNNSIQFEVSGDAQSGVIYIGTSALSLQTWYHFIATYNNGSMNIYLNGTLVNNGTYTGTGNFTNGYPVLIGTRTGDASRSLRGSVSTAKVYNRALSAAEVKQNFNALRGRYGI